MRAQFNTTEVEKLKTQLREIDASRVDGQFVTDDGKVAKGSEEISELLERALAWSDIVLERKGVIPEQWRRIYDVLIGIRNDLDKFSITPAWSLRETDLYDYQRQLDKIDEARVDGNWLDEEGKPAELYAQRVSTFEKQVCESIERLTDCPDNAVPHQAKLWLHLPLDGAVRASIGGTTAGI